MPALTKAMILAAGFGTRLKPLTLEKPKALVEVNGVPMIELVLKKLEDTGIKEVVINAHHFTDQMEKYFSEIKHNLRIDLICEKEILGTGGGIMNAYPFLKDAGDFLVHNVDVICDMDILKMYEFHLREACFATLAVQERDTTRPLLIDREYNIIGRRSNDKFFRYRQPSGAENAIGFTGIHIISSDIFHHFTEDKFFDIFTSYFRLISEGKKILGFDIGKKKWQDLGKYGNLTDISTV